MSLALGEVIKVRRYFRHHFYDFVLDALKSEANAGRKNRDLGDLHMAVVNTPDTSVP